MSCCDGIVIFVGSKRQVMLLFLFQILYLCYTSNDGRPSGTVGLLQPNISCSIISNNVQEKLFLVDNYETPENNVFFHPNILSKVHCTLIVKRKNCSVAAKLSFKVKYTQGTVEQQVEFANYSSDAYHAMINISQNASAGEHSISPFTLDIVCPNKTIILAKGTVIHLEILPTFSKYLTFAKYMEINQSDTKWKFLPMVCNKDIFLVTPEELDNATLVFPVGTAYGADDLNIIKWEQILLPRSRNSSKYQTMLIEHFLILSSKEDIFLIPSIQDQLHGNASRNIKEEVSWGLEISEILAISSSTTCLDGYIKNWYDTLVVFRLQNGSLAAMLSRDPFSSWELYTFPDWLQPAQYVTSQLDIQTHALILLVSIGEPLSSMIFVFKIISERRELSLHVVPFTLKSCLNAPILRLVQSIPALVVYDQSEVWLSVDGGRSFQHIFMAQDKDEIQHVVSSGSSKENLAIVCKSKIYEYSSRGLYKSEELSEIGCSTSGSVLWRINNAGSIKLYCHTPMLNTTLVSKPIHFSFWELVVPSFVAEVHNEYEVSMRLALVYQNISQFHLKLKSLCLIPRYPHLYMCDYNEMPNRSSLDMEINQGIQRSGTLKDCYIHLLQINSSKYLMRVSSMKPSTPYTSWLESIIGKSLQIPSLQAVCWVHWLLNQTTAEVVCSSHQNIGESLTLEVGKGVLIDSRGSERCFKANITLNDTSANSTQTLQPKFSDPNEKTYMQNATFIRLSETVAKLSHSNGSLVVELLSEAKKQHFNYICVISNQFQETGVIKRISAYAQTCHFNVTSEGLITPEMFLDAGDQIRFYITLIKQTTGVPYWDTIPPFIIKLSDQEHVKLQIKSYLDASTRRINVFLKQKPDSQGTTILKMHTPVQPAHCNNITAKMTIYGTCPPQKRLLFEYPFVYSRDTWLFGNPEDHDGIKRIAAVPYNYQPPSYMGKAIPMTSHIYNADPSKAMHRARYKITREMAKFKQCKGKLNRLACGCTDDMTISSTPLHSDCIQRVYNVDFHETFQPRIYILDANGTKTLLSFPFYVTEVNNRSDYSLENAIEKNRMSLFANSSIKFSGSGLYHFKVDVVKSGYTFCDLRTYFIMFVSDEPLPHPAQDLVRAMTSFCFGSVLLSVFLLNYYSPNRK